MASTSQTILLPVNQLDPAVEVLQTMGFRLHRISPADGPNTADLSLDSVAVRVTTSIGGTDLIDPETLNLEQLRRFASGSEPVPEPASIVDVEEPVMKVPQANQSLVIDRFAESGGFSTGRVGMGYRDLLPDRYGGRFIASHIRIADGGELSDYVHHHSIRFQLIFCRSGWVKVVYEDQGPPFVLEAGDCVLQPPGIRHRVLESSPGLEVVEVGCPAMHDTFVDHELSLPTGENLPDRLFGGQRFVRHVASEAEWIPGPWNGFEYQNTAIGSATSGLAGVRVLRPTSSATSVAPPASDIAHDSEFVFRFVLAGSLSLALADRQTIDELQSGDAVTIPSGTRYSISATGPDTRILEVTVPEWPENL